MYAQPHRTMSRQKQNLEPVDMGDDILVPIERIELAIYLIRGQKVMLDRDLAKIYGVSTFRLNEAVK